MKMKKRVLVLSMCLVLFLVLSIFGNVTGEFHSPDLVPRETTSITSNEEPVSPNGSIISLPMAFVDTTIHQNNNTELSEYDLMVNNINYQAYFKNHSDYGEVFRYIDTQYPDMWYIENFEEWLWVDEEQIDDYLGYNMGVTGYVDSGLFVYPDITTEGTMSVDMTLNTTGDSVLSEYHLSAMPRQPAEWLGDNIQLAFGFMFDFPADAQIVYGQSVVWDKTSNFVTNESIWFLDAEQDPNDVDWQLRSAFKIEAPFAIDSVGNNVSGEFRIQRKGASFWIYKEIPFDWLNDTAQFPVVIDPTVVDTTTQSSPWILGHRPTFSGANNHTFTYQDGTGLKASSWAIGSPATFTVNTVSTDTTIREHTMTGYPTNDTIYIFYQKDGADDIFFKKSTDAGCTFGSEITVKIGGAIQLHYPTPSLALSGTDAGRLMVAFRDSGYDVVIRYTDNEGTGWTEVTAIDDAVIGEDLNPGDLAWIKDETWILTARGWTGNDRDFIYRTVNGGDTWTLEYTSIEAATWSQPKIIPVWNKTGGLLRFSDEIEVVFLDAADTDDIQIQSTSDAGDFWFGNTRYDDGYPSTTYTGLTTIGDGAEDGYYLYALDNDGVGAIDDIQWEKKDSSWANPLVWAELVTGRDIYAYRFTSPMVTNLGGKGFVAWMETQTTPWNLVISEVSLSHAYEDPVNDQAPTFNNPDDTDYMYAHYKQYSFSCNVSDADGYADIDFVGFYIYNDARSDKIGMYYDEDEDEFSEVYNPTYFILDLDGSSAIKSGNDIDITFLFYIEWAAEDWTDIDSRQYVEDEHDLTDNNYYEDANWNIETRTDFSSHSLSDGSGTVDRGDYNTEDGITASGTVIYFGSALNPPTDEVDIWVSCTNVTGSPWNDTTLISGAFSMTVDSDDIVDEWWDVYTFKVVIEGTGSGGTDLSHETHTNTYIADRVQVQSYTVDDGRINIDSNAQIDILLYYDYDDTDVTTGTWTVNGQSLSHQGSGVWRATPTSATVQQIVYDTVAGSDTTHGITAVDQNSQSDDVIWDRVQVQSYSVDDTRVDTDVIVYINVTLWYDYDDTLVTDGTVTINGYSADHLGSGVWNITRTSATVIGVTYNNVQCSGNTHGITAEDNTVTQLVIWDRVIVDHYGSPDSRGNIDETLTTLVYLFYEYDSSLVTDGTVIDGSPFVWFPVQEYWGKAAASPNVVGILNDNIVVSGNTHGITVVNQNGQSITIIWDRVQVQSYTVVDERVDLNIDVNIDVLLWYDYDDTFVVDGDVSINGYAAVHQGSGVWRITRTSATVTGVTYNTVVTANNEHGIYEEDQNGQSVLVVWDRLNFDIEAYTWSVINYNVTLSITGVFEYDSSAWTGVITWIEQYPVESTVGYYVYDDDDFSSFTEPTYDLVGYTIDFVNVTFDDIYPTTSIARYWTQYTTTQVDLMWGAASYWKLEVNETWLTNIYSLHAYSNGSTPTGLGGIYGSGYFAGMAIGYYDPSWHYVNLTVNCELVIGSRSFDWQVWQDMLAVDILHSLQIVTFSIEPTDYYFWITFQTNLLNASITIWDDAIDSGVLFADNIYHSDFEGMHDIDRSTIVAAHNITICITSTGTDYGRDYTVHDYVWWYNFTYVVTDPPSYDCHIVILNNLYELIQFDTFEVYENGSRIYHDIIQVVDGYVYNITVKNRFGDTVNSTVFDADFEMVIFVNTYSFKFMNWYNGFLRVNVTRAGVTYSEIIMPTEIIEFNLFAETYVFSVDFLNGTTKFSQEIEVSNSTGYVITGDSITDVFDLVTSVYAMTTAINITVQSTNNYALTISIDLTNINTTINEQLIQVLLNITNTNSTIYDQTVDLLAYLQNINSTLYSQTVDILIELNYISSNVTAGFISVSTVLSAIDSNLYSNFTSVAATLSLIDSNLLSNFIAVTTTLTAIGSNITSNYLSVAATLSLIDSNLLSNFTNIVAQMLSVNSSITSQFITVIAYAVEMNTTMYLIDDPTHLNPMILGSDLSDDYCDFTVVTTWHNATIDIYDNNVKQAGPISELLSPIRYTLQTTPGTHNLSLFIDAGADSFWYNISYTLAEIILRYNTLSFVGDELTVTVTIYSNWGNGTITITDENGAYVLDSNDLEMNSRPEGSYTFRKITTDGFHDYTVIFDAGADGCTWDLQYSFEEEKSGSGFDEGDLEDVKEALNDTLDDIKEELQVWRPSPEDFLALGTIIILVVIVIGQWARQRRKDDKDAGMFGWLGLSFPKLRLLPKPRWFSKLKLRG